MSEKKKVMYDRPKTDLIIAAFVYWFLCYIFVPFGIVLFSVGLSEETPVTRAWLEIGYHTINGVLAVCVMRKYLANSSYNIGTEKKMFLKTSAIAALVMTVLGAAGYAVLAISGRPSDFFHYFPVVDQNLFLMTDTTVRTLPIPSLLCMTLFTPITVCCLFYSIGFAPAACRKSWLGYVSIILLFAVFHAYEYTWHLDAHSAISIFLFRLPVHLIACWAYRKTDTIWAPVLSLSAFNFMAIAACIFM